MNQTRLMIVFSLTAGCSDHGRDAIDLPEPGQGTPSVAHLTIDGLDDAAAYRLEVLASETPLDGPNCLDSRWFSTESVTEGTRAYFGYAWDGENTVQLDDLYTIAFWTDALGVWWMLRGGAVTVLDEADLRFEVRLDDALLCERAKPTVEETCESLNSPAVLAIEGPRRAETSPTSWGWPGFGFTEGGEAICGLWTR